MIERYMWDTPNSRKISIMLKEIRMPYNVHPVNLRNNKRKMPEFLTLNPNGRIPAIIAITPAGANVLSLNASADRGKA